jgi:hypothetical protein
MVTYTFSLTNETNRRYTGLSGLAPVNFNNQIYIINHATTEALIFSRTIGPNLEMILLGWSSSNIVSSDLAPLSKLLPWLLFSSFSQLNQNYFKYSIGMPFQNIVR